MPQAKAVSFKRKLEDTPFVEVGRGSSSHLNQQHTFEHSKTRKKSGHATPHDEHDVENIRSLRPRRQSDVKAVKIRAQRKLPLPLETHLFTLQPEIQQKNPSTGPVRPRRASARLSIASDCSKIADQDASSEFNSVRKRVARDQRFYDPPPRRSKRNQGKAKTSTHITGKKLNSDIGVKAKKHSNHCSEKHTTFTIHETAEDDGEKQTKWQIEEALEEFQDETDQSGSDMEMTGEGRKQNDESGSENEAAERPRPSRLRKKITKTASNPYGLRVSHPAVLPIVSSEIPKKKKRQIYSDSESDSESDGYLPTSDVEEDEEDIEPSTSAKKARNKSQSKSTSKKPKSQDHIIASKTRKSQIKRAQRKTIPSPILSSSEIDIQLPPRVKKKFYISPEYLESSEDTPDLHESSNFRTSPIATRIHQNRSASNNIHSEEEGHSFNNNPSPIHQESQQNSEDENSESDSLPVRRRWKGKVRALDTDDMMEEEEIDLNLGKGGSNQGSSPDQVNGLIQEDTSEEWDAGDLFGEKLTKSHTHTTPDSNPAESNSKKNPSASRTPEDPQSGLQDFRKAIFLLNSICSGNSTESKQIKNQVKVLTNMMDTYINNTPPPASNEDRFVSDSREDSFPSSQERKKQKASPSLTPRGARIRTLIKNLIRTLYGMKKQQKLVPNGATPAEKRGWMVNISFHELLNKSNNIPETREDLTSSTGDPSFPYTNGPGGEQASRRSTQIMWDVMRSVGVTSFRPDFSESLGSPGNMFLFRMASVILIKLVQSGEYSGISSDELEPKEILKLIVSHIKGTWARNFREQRQWSQERLQARDKRRLQKTRVISVREGRLAYVMSHKSLWPLAKVVQDCCSDDETDYEDADGRKYCKVRIVRWRSAQLDMIFESIDAARTRNNFIKSQPGNTHRTRTRSYKNPISDLLPPEEIYKDCISQAYYEQLEPWQREDIKIINKSILSTVKDMISKRLLPTAV